MAALLKCTNTKCCLSDPNCYYVTCKKFTEGPKFPYNDVEEAIACHAAHCILHLTIKYMAHWCCRPQPNATSNAHERIHSLMLRFIESMHSRKIQEATAKMAFQYAIVTNSGLADQNKGKKYDLSCFMRPTLKDIERCITTSKAKSAQDGTFGRAPSSKEQVSDKNLFTEKCKILFDHVCFVALPEPKKVVKSAKLPKNQSKVT